MNVPVSRDLSTMSGLTQERDQEKECGVDDFFEFGDVDSGSDDDSCSVKEKKRDGFPKTYNAKLCEVKWFLSNGTADCNLCEGAQEEGAIMRVKHQIDYLFSHHKFSEVVDIALSAVNVESITDPFRKEFYDVIARSYLSMGKLPDAAVYADKLLKDFPQSMGDHAFYDLIGKISAMQFEQSSEEPWDARSIYWERAHLAFCKSLFIHPTSVANWISLSDLYSELTTRYKERGVDEWRDAEEYSMACLLYADALCEGSKKHSSGFAKERAVKLSAEVKVLLKEKNATRMDCRYAEEKTPRLEEAVHQARNMERYQMISLDGNKVQDTLTEKSACIKHVRKQIFEKYWFIGEN